MFRAVLSNDVFHDPYELNYQHTTWHARNGPLQITIEPDYGMDKGTDGFFLDSYRDELDKPRHIRFSRRYPLGPFIERADTRFHECDIVQLRNYNDTVLHIKLSTLLSSLLRGGLKTNPISASITGCIYGCGCGGGCYEPFLCRLWTAEKNSPIYCLVGA